MVDEDGKPLAESTLRSWTNGNRQVNLADFMTLCVKAGADPALILFGRPLMRPELQKRVEALAQTMMEPENRYGKIMYNIKAGGGGGSMRASGRRKKT